jgi:hypothetical protein
MPPLKPSFNPSLLNSNNQSLTIKETKRLPDISSLQMKMSFCANLWLNSALTNGEALRNISNQEAHANAGIDGAIMSVHKSSSGIGQSRTINF